ncbi:LysR family transcriptional regulator [uncultured Cloacibacillus sp.]|uniref:LysR family transcriptional regulator n=1 Tax=uncultured Cloacibacillus sp. TaxID=889794 RepID=UPI0026207BA0|nr:LysR family transcriptional regulator [uncultured Cloacibacillus sp.]
MIDQRYYQYIQTIAFYCSFSRAAEALYITQPALSRFVKNVEKDLGVTIFDRESEPLKLTPAGQQYLEYITKFIELEENMRKELKSRQDAISDVIRVAAIPTFSAYMSPYVIPYFIKQYQQQCDLKFYEYTNKYILNRLGARELDIAIMNRMPEIPDLTYTKIMNDPILLVVPYNNMMKDAYPGCVNNLDNPIKIDKFNIKNETLFILQPWQNMRLAADRICNYYELVPKRTIEVRSVVLALSFVSSGIGITFACPSQIRSIHPKGDFIYFIPSELANITDAIAAFYSTNNNPWIRPFCQCCINALTHI